jgi:hypothetical protein
VKKFFVLFLIFAIAISLWGCAEHTIETPDGGSIVLENGAKETLMHKSEFIIDRIDVVASKGHQYGMDLSYVMVAYNDDVRFSCFVTEREYTLLGSDDVMSGEIVCENYEGALRYYFVCEEKEHFIIYSTLEE